jgi:MoxR-like ATPase
MSAPDPNATPHLRGLDERRPGPALADPEALRIGTQLREVARALDQRFLGRGEVIRLLLVSLVAGEHMLIVGPPGTAKSALLRHLSRLVDARFFEYLLTRFSEPSEIFGPVDIKAFREGTYLRRTEQMLPEAEIVFLDEIFKANSAILNSLLSILNERRFYVGSERRRVPLCSLFGATNEVPNDDALGALFDRFLVRAVADNLDSFHFQGLVERGIRNEIAESSGADDQTRPLVKVEDIRNLQRRIEALLRFPDEFLVRYKALIAQIRAEGVTISDRRVVKLLKLFAANALVEGRPAVDEGEFFILKHVWNNVDQVQLLQEIVDPVLERHHREHPQARRVGAVAADLDVLLTELGTIRNLLLGGETLSDVLLFSQLRNLQDIRAALQALGTETATRMVGEVDKLLEGVFESSRWNG